MSFANDEHLNEVKSILTYEDVKNSVKKLDRPNYLGSFYFIIGVCLTLGIMLLPFVIPVGIGFILAATGLILLIVNRKMAFNNFVKTIDSGEFNIRTISVIKVEEKSSSEGPDYLLYYSNGRKDYVEFEDYKSAIVGETFFVVDVPKLKFNSKALFSILKYELEDNLVSKLVDDSD